MWDNRRAERALETYKKNVILSNSGAESWRCQQTVGARVRAYAWCSTWSPPIQFYLPQCLNIFLWPSWLVLSTIKLCVACASGCKLHQILGGGAANTWSDVAVEHGKLFPSRWEVHRLWRVVHFREWCDVKEVICWLYLELNTLNDRVGESHAAWLLNSKVRMKVDFIRRTVLFKF